MNCQLLHGDCLHLMSSIPAASIDSIITDPPYGLEFMGKEWDKGVPGAPFWEAALRVAKPGAMLLAFGGTRTHHRLMVAIEDAGWEIRDCLMWLYGSGFPKSHDISKAIDKAAGAEREQLGLSPNRRPGHETGKSWKQASPHSMDYQITAPATPEAQRWSGWGTALKPAWEPIILAMKPLDGTFAHNALLHGVAGINVDATRVEASNRPARETHPFREGVNYSGNSLAGRVDGTLQSSRAIGTTNLGRWPANLILDEEAAAMLDEQTGVPYGDSGGASRFFYVAKASKAEKGKNNNHPSVKPLKIMEYLCRLTATPTGGTVLDPFMGSGTTGIACANTGRNFIGIEKNADYFAVAQERIAAAYGY